MTLKYETIRYERMLSYGRHGLSHRKFGPSVIHMSGHLFYRRYGMKVDKISEIITTC